MISFEAFFGTTLLYTFYDRLNPYRQFLDPVGDGRKYLIARCKRVLVFISLVYVIFGQLTQIYLSFSKTGNFYQVIESLAWVIVALISLDVCVTIPSQSTPIINILHSLKRIYPEDGHTQEEIDVKSIWNPLAALLDLYFKSHTVTVFAKALTPFANALIALWIRGQWDLVLPFHVWYPFDSHNPKIFPLVYVYECWAILISTVPCIVITSIVGGISSVLCVQLKGLAHAFSTFKRNGNSSDKSRLISLIQKHCDLILMSEDLMEVFSSFLLRNYFYCSTGISLFMFVAVTTENTEVVIEYVSGVICFNIYIATLSYFGQRLIENVRVGGCVGFIRRVVIIFSFQQSTAISDAIYENGYWLEADPELRKYLLLVMLRSSKPLFLSGRGFFVVSFESFSKVKLFK